MSDTDDSLTLKTDGLLDATPARTPGTAVFASFNVHHGRLRKGRVDLSAYARAVASLGADVVALQEVDDGMLRSRRVDMTALAARASSGHGAFMPARRRWDLGRYGNAVVSTSSVRDVLHVQLPQLNWRNERRAAIVAAVDVDGVSWTVASTHLSLFKAESERQLGYLLDVVAQRPAPRVVMGDLNRSPEDVTDLASARGWQVADSDPTYPSWGPDQRIDFVLTQQAHVVATEVRCLEISDHCALVATLKGHY